MDSKAFFYHCELQICDCIGGVKHICQANNSYESLMNDEATH